MGQDLNPITVPPVGFDFLAELERTGALTKTSLTLTKEIPFAQWEALGGLFGAVKKTTSFLIGDWINHGEAVYGEKYAQAAALTGLSPETLTVYASVCRRIARSRRREELSFGHHTVVAALEPKEQTKWLSAAIENAWSRSELKRAIDVAGEAPPATEQPSWTPALTEAPAPTESVRELPSGAPLAELYVRLRPEHETSSNGTVTATTVLAELGRRIVEEAIPQGPLFVRIPRATFDELAAVLAEE